MSTSDRVLVELVVAAPIEEVWKAMRDPAILRRWFGWEYPGLDDELQFIVASKTEPTGTAYVQHIEGMADRYTLEALDATHTVVRVIRAAPVDDVSWTGIYDDLIDGWLTFLQQLRFLFDRHVEDVRRTIFLNGRTTTASAPLPVDALGLRQLEAVPIGQPYAATLGTGESISGTLWYRSSYQLGITIDGYGDGLLIVTTRPTTAKSPHGGGTAIVSTYGLTDDAFRALHQRWSDWWRAHYEVIEIQP